MLPRYVYLFEDFFPSFSLLLPILLSFSSFLPFFFCKKKNQDTLLKKKKTGIFLVFNIV